jgi:hypothetical protein
MASLLQRKTKTSLFKILQQIEIKLNPHPEASQYQNWFWKISHNHKSNIQTLALTTTDTLVEFFKSTIGHAVAKNCVVTS